MTSQIDRQLQFLLSFVGRLSCHVFLHYFLSFCLLKYATRAFLLEFALCSALLIFFLYTCFPSLLVMCDVFVICVVGKGWVAFVLHSCHSLFVYCSSFMYSQFDTYCNVSDVFFLPFESLVTFAVKSDTGMFSCNFSEFTLTRCFSCFSFLVVFFFLFFP